MNARDNRLQERTMLLLELNKIYKNFISRPQSLNMKSDLMQIVLFFLEHGYQEGCIESETDKFFYQEIYPVVDDFSVSPTETRFIIASFFEITLSPLFEDIRENLEEGELEDSFLYFGDDDPEEDHH